MIGNLRVKNRIGMAPMGNGQKDPDGGMAQGLREYFAERAKGGTSMIFYGALVTGEVEGAFSTCLDEPKFFNRMEQATDMMHGYGAKACLQVLIGTGRVGGAIPGVGKCVSASAVPAFWDPTMICQPLTTDQVEMLANKMGTGCAMAKRAGFDCIEIHAYGGYLMDQFLSAAWNKRTDKYGGDLTGRMRLLMECIENIQKCCGKDYPIIVKYSPQHYFEGGRKLEEGLEMARRLEAAGVAALHVDPGSYETWNKIIPTVYEYKRHYSLEAAEAVKKVVNIPVMASGHFGDPEFAEQCLLEGKLDYILLGRPLLADPNWVTKVKENRLDDLVPCILCNKGCMERCFEDKRTGCALNPLTGREKQNLIVPSSHPPRKILVVGGGPGGCMAAITAAEQGHQVELWEKTRELGGNVIAAAAPVFKKDVRRLVQYHRTQVAKHNIKVRYMKEGTPEAIKAGNFDMVICAIGGTPVAPKLPGMERDNVVFAADVLKEKKFTGEQVVVIGGGLVGMETALDLDMKGKKVTVVEMLDKVLAENLFPTDRMSLNELIDASGLTLLPGHKLLSVEDAGVHVEETATGEEKTIPCDTVVLAMGFKPNFALEDAIRDAVPDVVTIGNADKPATILKAVWEGYHAIKTITERE